MLVRPRNKNVKLIVGLGNPGIKYEATRHNIGFIVVDHVAMMLKCEFSMTKWDAVISKLVAHETPIILAKPQTYMNLSGSAVKKIIDFYQIECNDMLVIHDDADLEFGKIKLKVAGGSAGHNGIQSIMDHTGPDFSRLRIGIGREGDNLADFVLSRFSGDELGDLEKIIDDGVNATMSFIKHGPTLAMNAINRRIT